MTIPYVDQTSVLKYVLNVLTLSRALINPVFFCLGYKCRLLVYSWRTSNARNKHKAALSIKHLSVPRASVVYQCPSSRSATVPACLSLDICFPFASTGIVVTKVLCMVRVLVTD